MDKLQFLESLSKSGVEFVVSMPSPNGGDSIPFKPKELVKFSENPEAHEN